MAKWWKIANYVINPVGSALAELAKKAGVDEKVAHNVATPFGASWFSSLGRKSRADQKRKSIEQIANDAGMSLEEFLAVNPDMAWEYENADKSFVDKAVSKVKNAFKEIRENPDVDALINNVTGERDTAENEKNRQFQHDEAEISRLWEEEQAKVAREWDSIGAQMERAAAVGVNPISIAMQNGGIGSSATTSIPSAPSAPAGSANLTHSGALDIAGMVFNGIGTLAENRLKQSQSDDIVAMRQYNIAESMARTDHYRSLCDQIGLSNVAQSMQNEWIDLLNYGTYQASLGNSAESFASAKLKVNQIAEVQQNMDMAIRRFNATLPLEIQLSEAELNLKKLSAQDIIQNISMKHLQLIEQENRNIQSAAEAEGVQVTTALAKATFEDAIAAFHNDMVKGAAEAGISLQDYMYYNARPNNVWQVGGSIGGLFHDFINAAKKGKTIFGDPSTQIKGVDLGK